MTHRSRALLLALLAVPLWLVGATAASAHTALTSSSPADGSTVTDPLDAVVLTFGGTVRGPEVTVTGPDGGTVSTTAVADGSTVTVPVAPTATGAHTVTWAVSSADGHDLTGTLGFTYAGPVPTAAPTTSAPAATTPAPSTAEAAAEQPLATEPTGSTAGTTGTVVVVLLVAVVVLGLVTAGLRRRR